jgi:O-antigen/teichoic acid export membrane protein
VTSVARGSLIIFVAQLVANAGFFVAVLILARGLGPEGRGTVAFVIVSALILARFAALGLSESVLVFASSRPGLRPQLLANQLAFALTSATVVGGVTAGALLLLGASAPAGIGANEVALIFVGTIAVTLVDLIDAFVIGCGRIVQRAVVAAVTPWVYAGVIGILLAAGSLTVTRAGAGWATANALSALALVGIALGLASPTRPNLPLLRESIAFGVKAWVGMFASFLNMRFDQILLGLIATQTALGIYAVAVNGSEVLLYFPAALQQALIPALARVDPKARDEQTLRTFRIVLLLTTASLVVAVLLGPRLLPLLFGARFQGSVDAFLWLLPGALGFATAKVFSSALLASSSSGLYSVGAIAALITGISLDLILIPAYGAVGAAAAASAALLVSGTASLLLYRTRSRFRGVSLVPGPGDVAMLGHLAARLPAEIVPAMRPRPMRPGPK